MIPTSTHARAPLTVIPNGVNGKQLSATTTANIGRLSFCHAWYGMRYVPKAMMTPKNAHINCFRNMVNAEPPLLTDTIDEADNTMTSPRAVNTVTLSKIA